MQKLFASGSVVALTLLLALSTASAQQSDKDATAQHSSTTAQPAFQADSTGQQQQRGGWHCPWCGSRVEGYAQSGMGYYGHGMGPGMMGGGMMGGMMGGGYQGEYRGGYQGGPEGSQLGSRRNPGLAIFQVNCSSCHPGGGNSIYPNLPVRGAPQLANFKSFLAFLRKPTMPDGSRGPMPPFPASRLSEQQAHELYRYIVGAQQSGGQPRESNRPLNREQVKRLMENYIHNTRNPNLKLGKITKERGKDYYMATITTHDGSLVDKIEINEYTGRFHSIYGR